MRTHTRTYSHVRFHTAMYALIQLCTAITQDLFGLNIQSAGSSLIQYKEYIQQYSISRKSMLLRIARYTVLYLLVQVYRILRECAIDCYKTCINCCGSGSYKLKWHSMVIYLESCTPGQVGTKRYKAVYPTMRDSMLFLCMFNCGMYSLVP